MSLKKSKEIAKNLDIDVQKIVSLSEVSEENLSNKFTKKELQNIAEELGYDFDELFEQA